MLRKFGNQNVANFWKGWKICYHNYEKYPNYDQKRDEKCKEKVFFTPYWKKLKKIPKKVKSRGN